MRQERMCDGADGVTYFRCPSCAALVAAGGETCRMCGASLQWPDGEAAPPTAIAQDGTQYPIVEADDEDK